MSPLRSRKEPAHARAPSTRVTQAIRARVTNRFVWVPHASHALISLTHTQNLSRSYSALFASSLRESPCGFRRCACLRDPEILRAVRAILFLFRAMPHPSLSLSLSVSWGSLDAIRDSALTHIWLFGESFRSFTRSRSLLLVVVRWVDLRNAWKFGARFFSISFANDFSFVFSSENYLMVVSHLIRVWTR